MAVRGRDLRNTAVRPESLTTRPAPAPASKPVSSEDPPETDPRQLLDHPRLKGPLAEALLGLLREPVYRVKDVAALYRVSEKKVRRDYRKGALPALNVGGEIRFLRADVAAYAPQYDPDED